MLNSNAEVAARTSKRNITMVSVGKEEQETRTTKENGEGLWAGRFRGRQEVFARTARTRKTQLLSGVMRVCRSRTVYWRRRPPQRVRVSSVTSARSVIVVVLFSSIPHARSLALRRASSTARSWRGTASPLPSPEGTHPVERGKRSRAVPMVLPAERHRGPRPPGISPRIGGWRCAPPLPSSWPPSRRGALPIRAALPPSLRFH